MKPYNFRPDTECICSELNIFASKTDIWAAAVLIKDKQLGLVKNMKSTD